MMKQTYFNYFLNPNFNIENFFVGKANIYAYTSVLDENNNSNNFFLFGPKKSGKSHLGSIWQNKFNALKFKNNLNEIIENKKNIYIEDLFH